MHISTSRAKEKEKMVKLKWINFAISVPDPFHYEVELTWLDEMASKSFVDLTNAPTPSWRT